MKSGFWFLELLQSFRTTGFVAVLIDKCLHYDLKQSSYHWGNAFSSIPSSLRCLFATMSRRLIDMYADEKQRIDWTFKWPPKILFKIDLTLFREKKGFSAFPDNNVYYRFKVSIFLLVSLTTWKNIWLTQSALELLWYLYYTSKQNTRPSNNCPFIWWILMAFSTYSYMTRVLFRKKHIIAMFI